MIREWGSPTLFLMFSCAEYQSPDIENYLRNNVPPSYSVGKLCTEDPISVSRKFSLKFHSFFQKVLVKGEVLGTVDHFYWKKDMVLLTTMSYSGLKYFFLGIVVIDQCDTCLNGMSGRNMYHFWI